VLRLRWFEPDDPAIAVDWRVPSLIIATLFLNVTFWYQEGSTLAMLFPLPLYGGFVAAAALLMSALFFAGPALMAQKLGRPIEGVLESSLGSAPAWGVRLCCATFWVFWMAAMMGTGGLFWLRVLPRKTDVSATGVGLIAADVLFFLLLTGLQNMRVSAKLAWFTNKFALAVLVAALIRVHEGWPAVIRGVPMWSRPTPFMELWPWLSRLAFYMAPLGLLAARFGHRVRGRRQVAMMGLMGFVLPLAGTLLVVGVMGIATWASPFYQPSLAPTIDMALGSHASHRWMPVLGIIFAITIFGAVRFGLKAMAESVRIPVMGRFNWVTAGCLIGAAAWFTSHPYLDEPWTAFQVSVECLTVAGAVVTADYVSGRRIEPVRRVDWVGTVALLAGVTTPLWMPLLTGIEAETWRHPWLLPSYGVGSAVCLAGRMVEKLELGTARQVYDCACQEERCF
jgi:hypothetical protein